MGASPGRPFGEEELPFTVGGKELPLLEEVDESTTLDTAIPIIDLRVYDSEVFHYSRETLDII